MAIHYKSVGALVRAVRFARANPHIQFRVPGEFPVTGEEVVANFRAGVMKRCNRGLTPVDDQRFADLMHDARVINDAARRIRWPGRNLLHSPKLAARYPEIHNPPAFD